MQLLVYSCTHAKEGPGGGRGGQRICGNDRGEPAGPPSRRRAGAADLTLLRGQALPGGLSVTRPEGRIPGRAVARRNRRRVQLPPTQRRREQGGGVALPRKPR